MRKTYNSKYHEKQQPLHTVMPKEVHRGIRWPEEHKGNRECKHAAQKI